MEITLFYFLPRLENICVTTAVVPDNAVEKVAISQAVFDGAGQNWILGLQHNQNTETTAIVPDKAVKKVAVFHGGGQNEKKLKKRTKITISLHEIFIPFIVKKLLIKSQFQNISIAPVIT